MRFLNNKEIDNIILRALREDIGEKDITTLLAVPAHTKATASIVAKEPGILCGGDIAKRVFKKINPNLAVKVLIPDGRHFRKGTMIISVHGKAQSILSGERVALNFLSLLSGIATCTHAFVAQTRKTKTRIMDTRKTTPTLRLLEKYAVKTGGGMNHRRNLSCGIIVKDNHLKTAAVIQKKHINEQRLAALISRLRKQKKLPVEIEVESFSELKKIIAHKPDIVLLDNFTFPELKRAVAYRNRHHPDVRLESSGGIRLKNIKRIADCGVDFISAGAITHSSRSIDFSLEVA